MLEKTRADKSLRSILSDPENLEYEIKVFQKRMKWKSWTFLNSMKGIPPPHPPSHPPLCGGHLPLWLWSYVAMWLCGLATPKNTKRTLKDTRTTLKGTIRH